jgi:feruloyl esterase
MGAGAVALALAMPGAAHATSCSASAINALHVPNVTVATAAPDPTLGGLCHAIGSVTTKGFGAPDGSAGFDLVLPPVWNGKFIFWGVGGFGGGGISGPTPDAALNPVDAQLSLQRGYAVAITDTGHQSGNTDASFSLKAPGVPNEAALTDYYFRATHEVTVSMKEVVEAFFDGTIQRAYFAGCSNGGRQAFVEATKFPDDYDGIIAGAPFFDIRTILAGVKIQKQQLQSAQTYIPATLLPAIDAAIYKACDAADGVPDNLIQNPAACNFDPNTLVGTLLTQGQADTLKSYFTALRDEHGDVVYTGAAVSDLHGGGMDAWTTGFVPPTSFTAREPWGGTGFSPAPIAWQFVDHLIQDIVDRDPNADMRAYDVSIAGVVAKDALRLFDRRTEVGDGDVPETLIPFIKKGKKLLVYHGWSDPALTPTRTIRYYEQLAATLEEPFSEVQNQVRLFMVPGMQHCGGGPGPNNFDTLTALENWVEHGQGPDSIIAASSAGRTMPLCKFPEQAQYDGKNPVNLASSWTCAANNRGQLQVGANGREAGLPFDGDRDDDDRDDNGHGDNGHGDGNGNGNGHGDH